MKLLVTGGAGFIGSAFVRMAISETDLSVVNLDKLTYAGNLENLAEIDGNARYRFVQGDICDPELVNALVGEERPDAIVHFAAESHVRSEEHTSELQSLRHLVCRLLLEKKNHTSALLSLGHIACGFRLPIHQRTTV